MISSSQNCRNFKPANKQAIALALLICFISAFLLSGALILTHTDHAHDHNGDGGSCAACLQIQNAENVLRLLATAAAISFAFRGGHYTVTRSAKAMCPNIVTFTPITAKTRMNN